MCVYVLADGVKRIRDSKENFRYLFMKMMIWVLQK